MRFPPLTYALTCARCACWRASDDHSGDPRSLSLSSKPWTGAADTLFGLVFCEPFDFFARWLADFLWSIRSRCGASVGVASSALGPLNFYDCGQLRGDW